jgi:hypothetical protein
MPTRTRRANPLRVSEARNDGTLIRKTSLQDRTDNPLRSSKRLTKQFRTILRSYGHAGSAYRTRSLSRSRSDTRNDLLFTMSDITRLSHTHEIRAHESIDAGSRELLFWTSRKPDWWSQTGSNRRPPACKAGALPAELWPRKSVSLLTGLSAEDWWAWEDLNFRPHAYQARALTN